MGWYKWTLDYMFTLTKIVITFIFNPTCSSCF